MKKLTRGRHCQNLKISKVESELLAVKADVVGCVVLFSEIFWVVVDVRVIVLFDEELVEGVVVV